MFDRIFKQPYAIKRYLNAPLLEDRLSYLTYRAKQGTPRSMLHKISSFQVTAIKYLDLDHNDRVITIKELEVSAKRWARHEMQRFCLKDFSYPGCKSHFLRETKNWLKFLDRMEIPRQPVPSQVTEFLDRMRNENGLSEVTIGNRCYFLKKFIGLIKEDLGQFLAHLTPERLDKILIQEFHEGRYARCTIQSFSSDLRIFLRYAEYRGWCQPGIADSIKTPRVYKHQILPSSPSWDDVQRLLKTTEGDRPVDIRDRAILLLLVVYGLRNSEVKRLRFDDLDWEREAIHIRRSKHGPTDKLPLIQTVGQSLIRYIKEVRPQCSIHQEIFLTLYAPFRPLSTLYAIVKNRWKPLNVAIEHHGPHSLRHACATRLINQGMSIKTIADQLGHRNLDTTSIYAKVDLTRLREVARFNMGGIS